MDEEEVVKNIAHRAKNDGIFVGWEFCKNDCPFILIAEKRKEKAYILTTKTINEGFFALEGYRKQSDTVREFVDRIAEFASAMRLLANKEYEESRLVKAMYAQGKMDAVGYMIKEMKKLAKEYGAEVEE